MAKDEKTPVKDAKKAPKASNTAQNSRYSKLIGIVVVLVAAFGLMAVLGGEQGYSEQVRQNYVDACVEASGQNELCGCTYDKLSEQISYSDFKALDERAGTGETTEEDNELLTGVAFACVADIRGN